jgi:hypothetical protein
LAVFLDLDEATTLVVAVGEVVSAVYCLLRLSADLAEIVVGVGQVKKRLIREFGI